MRTPSGLGLLRSLASMYGIQTAYYGVSRRRQIAGSEALLSTLRSLGAPLTSINDTSSALRERRQSFWQRLIEPVMVSWDTSPLQIDVRLPASISASTLAGSILLENGESRRYIWHGADLLPRQSVEVEGVRYVVKRLSTVGILPHGYHRFVLEAGGSSVESLVISSPIRAYLPEGEESDWGIFMPLYALYTRQSLGVGDYSDFEALMMWLSKLGGKVLTSLPLLPVFIDRIYEPSPYLPVSRFLWNEFYLDINRIPELERCPEAKSILSSDLFQREAGLLKKQSLIDYRKSMALKRRVLEELCRCCFEQPARLEELNRFIASKPEVEDYARFRAAVEKQATPSWRRWSETLRQGILKEGDFDETARRYYVYAQWQAHEQVRLLSEKAKKSRLKLYLDLPIGIHADGYDVWREQKSFLLDMMAGAPPDAVFTQGQNWLFPPSHPEKIREQGYKYIIKYLRHHLNQSSILRIDHVMSLHRLFVIPRGMEPGNGVYLRYKPEELYAILTLESHRAQTVIVGEDLGTVPTEVKSSMSRHGFNHMYVLHYELASSPELHYPKHNSVTSLNTHDMPPFASFWRGLDIGEWQKLGLLSESEANSAREQRQITIETLTKFLKGRGLVDNQPDERTAMMACLSFLSSSQSRVVLVNLEDLWFEVEPQNIPGTHDESPNWQRRARYSLEEFSRKIEVLDALSEIARLRKKKLGVEKIA